MECKGVTKRYAYRGAAAVRIRKFLGMGGQLEAPGFLALRGVDLEVRPGERVGIVGRNGAGKTTLLKLIAGRSAITSGDLHVDGDVHALMELGVGFHPEFSGRVNITSGLVHLGLSGEELEEAVADVVDFVELGDHLDQPLRTYSRGMKTRLMFAAATVLRPDVLLIDEVLGAGDPYFTAKAADRVKDLVAEGCTLLLVSHSPQQMLQFCERVVWMHEGRIVQDGDAVEVLNAYEAYIEHSSERLFTPAAASNGAGDEDGEPGTSITLADGREVHTFPGKKGVKFRRVAYADAGPGDATAKTGDPSWVEFDLEGELDGDFAVRYTVTFWRSDGRRVARAENTLDRFSLGAGDVHTVRVDLGPLSLGPGEYTITFGAYDIATGGSAAARTVRYDVVSRAIRLTVEPADGMAELHPATVLPGRWRMVGASP